MGSTNTSHNSHSPSHEHHNDSLSPENTSSVYTAQSQIHESIPSVSENQHDDSDQVIEPVVASLESQVQELCGLLDNFKSSFETKLQALHAYLHSLPDHVGGNYNGRQRAHLLSMYGRSTRESSELAINKLKYDMARLEMLANDDATHLYGGYANTESIISSLQPSPSPPNSTPPLNFATLSVGDQNSEHNDMVPSVPSLQPARWDTPSPELRQQSGVPFKKSMSDGHHEAAGDFRRSKLPLRSRLRAWRRSRQQ